MPRLRIAIIVSDEREMRSWHELPEPIFGPAPSALLEGFRQLPEEIEVHVVSCIRAPLRAPERLADNIFYHVVPVPNCGFLRTLYMPAIRKIRQKLRAIRPHIVHGQGTERYCAPTAVFSGFPNVITIHGNMRQVARALEARVGSAHWFYHWLTARMETVSLSRTGGVVCLSRYTEEQVQSLARRTWLVPNAVTDEFFTLKRQPSSERTLVCVANIFPYKNQIRLIQSLDPIADKLNFRLIFLGAGNPNRAYTQEFERLVKARPWCAHPGYKSGKDLWAFLSSAHGLVLPSVEDNCPMVIIEAMAAGIPIAAARIGGIPDLIEHHVNGLLFNPTDLEDIQNKISSLLCRPQEAEAFAARGRQRALEQYRPVVIAREHVKIYRAMLGSAIDADKNNIRDVRLMQDQTR